MKRWFGRWTMVLAVTAALVAAAGVSAGSSDSGGRGGASAVEFDNGYGWW
ncbi:hypothetical protein [Streptodolium elevatio]|uniref:Uncharacterized protein n=1 Tax=Streptodolium elevatio TaxID=3157996 RepID=A0ABV3DR38_9ACTN